jgi:poly-gamma-glutamate synthesis protein (capsule biosynthesis protein)
MAKRKKTRIKKKSFVFLLIFIIAVVASTLVFSYIKPVDKKLIKDELKTSGDVIPLKEYKLSLVMVGDSLYHPQVYKDGYKNGKYDFTSQLSEVKPLIQKYDLAYYNQESILAGTTLKLSGYPQFNSPQEVGDAFIDAGFNLVSLANNHTMDKYEKGVRLSVEYWRKQEGVYWTGQALSEQERTDNIKVEEKNGIKYAFLSYTTVTNGLLPPKGKEYLTNIYSEEKAKKDIALVKGKADVILVAMHWGTEYQISGLAKEQKTISKFLASQGVDIIIGAHPHVIQPAEFIDNTLVIYSLGNFISSQSNNYGAKEDEKLSGLMMSVDIVKTENPVTKETKIQLVDPTAHFVYTYKKNLKNYKIYPYTKLNTNIFPRYKNQYEILKKRMTSLDSRIKVESLG